MNRNVPWAGLSGALLLFGAAAASAAVKAGDPAPALVSQTIDDKPFDLKAERGHVVVVNLWATWCPPCRAEMPMLDALAKDHAADGLKMVGLSADRRRDLGEVREVMRAFHYPSVLAVEAKANGFGAPRTLPITYVISAKGVVAAVLQPTDRPLSATRLNAAVADAAH